MSDNQIRLASGGVVRVANGNVDMGRPDGSTAATFSLTDLSGVHVTGRDVHVHHRTAGAIVVGVATDSDAHRLASLIGGQSGVIEVAGVVHSPAVAASPAGTFAGAATPEDAIRSQVREILMANEDIVCIAMQDQRAPTVKKAAAIATDHRLILYRPSLVGSFNFWDKRWHDIHEVHIKQGMMFSELSIRTTSGEHIILDKMNKEQARSIYGIAQQQEHQWKEHRRQRQMEEDRAKAGGVTVTNTLVPGAAIPGVPVAQAPAVEDPMAKLSRAKQMLDAGLISQAEYDEVKSRVLAGF